MESCRPCGHSYNDRYGLAHILRHRKKTPFRLKLRRKKKRLYTKTTRDSKPKERRNGLVGNCRPIHTKQFNTERQDLRLGLGPGNICPCTKIESCPGSL